MTKKNIYRDLISLQGEQETTLATKLKFSLKKISELYINTMVRKRLF